MKKQRRIREELQIACLAKAQEADSRRKAYDVLKEERQMESIELANLTVAHQIALRNVQMTQNQLQELMSLPMMPPSNKAQTQEIATLQKDKDELTKQV